MIAFTDSQMQTVVDGARGLPRDKRDLYLRRLGAMLTQRNGFDDGDVADAVELALCGLVHRTDSAA